MIIVILAKIALSFVCHITLLQHRFTKPWQSDELIDEILHQEIK